MDLYYLFYDLLNWHLYYFLNYFLYNFLYYSLHWYFYDLLLNLLNYLLFLNYSLHRYLYYPLNFSNSLHRNIDNLLHLSLYIYWNLYSPFYVLNLSKILIVVLILFLIYIHFLLYLHLDCSLDWHLDVFLYYDLD